jgi:hypothetical protein
MYLRVGYRFSVTSIVFIRYLAANTEISVRVHLDADLAHVHHGPSGPPRLFISTNVVLPAEFEG